MEVTSDRLTQNIGASDKRYFNTDEVAAYLGVSRHTIGRMVKRHEIPFIPYGRVKRFDRFMIEEWSLKRTVKAKL